MRRILYLILFTFIFCCSSLFPSSLLAQDTLGIAAIVNDKVITITDLKNRIELILISGSFPKTEENLRQLTIQILKTLIDEELQAQDALKKGIKITPDEIEKAIQAIEAQNNLPSGKLRELLESNNIPFKTLEDQVHANLAWVRLIGEMYGPNIIISDKEIEEVLKTMSNSVGTPQVRLSEIFLSIDTPDKEQETLKIAHDLVKDMRHGASFDLFARQFSESPSAAQGGDLGWVRVGQYDGAFDDIIKTQEVGKVSDPIRTKSGVYILFVADREKEGETTESVVDLKQITLSLFLDRSNEALENAAKTLEESRSEITSCENVEQIADKIGGHVDSFIGIPENKLPLPLQSLIKNLPLNVPSSPVKSENAAGLVIVCKRDQTKTQMAPLPDKETLRQKLFGQKLELIARRVLRDLRRAAFIETRI